MKGKTKTITATLYVSQEKWNRNCQQDSIYKCFLVWSFPSFVTFNFVFCFFRFFTFFFLLYSFFSRHIKYRHTSAPHIPFARNHILWTEYTPYEKHNDLSIFIFIVFVCVEKWAIVYKNALHAENVDKFLFGFVFFLLSITSKEIGLAALASMTANH